VGLLVLALMDRLRVDLMGYLFGDVLAVSRATWRSSPPRPRSSS
jgi:ABC-type Mn2+/Zn2+ transport system permease subunit